MNPTKPISRDDFQRIQLLSDPQFSPDGAQIAFVKRHTDVEKNKTRSEIWTVPAQGGEPRRFTGGDWNDSSPRWSPDGKQIAFLSDRNKPKNQIFLIPTDGGEARELTRLETEGAIEAIRWSPDGAKIAFLFRAIPDGYRKEQVEKREKKGLSNLPRHHTRLNYRHDGDGFHDGEYAQVWVADAQTGETKQLTTGDFPCGPPIFFPDSKTLAFVSNRDPDSDLHPEREAIFTIPIEGGELTRIPAPDGPKESLACAPDGKTLAYIGNPDPRDFWGTNNPRIYALPVEGGEPRDVTGHTDQCVGYYTLSDVHTVGAGDTLRWNAAGSAVFFPLSVQGSVRLCFVGLGAGGDVIPISPDGQEMGGFDITPDGRAAVTLGTPTTPHELFLLRAPRTANSGVEVTPLTHFNREFVEETQIVEPEPIAVPNGEGGAVPGWLLRPPDFDPTQTYPCILYVHGGPHLQYGNMLFHELQWLAAEGHVVVYANPRGSIGYGEAHTKAIKGDWGGPDFRDVMAVADYAASRDYVDETRMAIMGGSYGGFMTAWAIGHTDRFACAIADRLVGNIHSMSGTTDFAWPHGDYFGGNSWADPMPMWKCSPLAYAGHITTPLLLIHSDGDLRCDIGQAEELFAALRLQGKTVEFVRYPAETSHDLSRNGPPDLRRDRLQRNLDWLNRWLKSIGSVSSALNCL